MRCHKEKCIFCEIFSFVSEKSFECIGILNSIFLYSQIETVHYLFYFTREIKQNLYFTWMSIKKEIKKKKKKKKIYFSNSHVK
jgi:hypothetical protein